jgi:hypothetical protein
VSFAICGRIPYQSLFVPVDISISCIVFLPIPTRSVFAAAADRLARPLLYRLTSWHLVLRSQHLLSESSDAAVIAYVSGLSVCQGAANWCLFSKR